MSRGQRHTKHLHRRSHSDQGTWAGHEHYVKMETWCGAGVIATETDRSPDDQRRADCPKCAKAAGKAKLATYNGRMELVEMVQDKTNWRSFRSAWNLMIDGELRGHVVSRAGFGTGWELYSVAEDASYGSNNTVGRSLSGERPSTYQKIPEDRDLLPLHYSGRDAMACAAMKIFLARPDDLPTAAEAIARREANKIKQRLDNAQREQDREAARIRSEARQALENERRVTAVDGLVLTLLRNDLTNLQRAGVQAALDIINGVRVI